MVLIHVLVHAAGNMRSTLYPTLKEEFSLTNQQIGLIAAIPALCQVIFSIPAGLFSDRFGAKKLIALSILMAAVGAFLGSISVDPWMYIVATTLLTLNSTIYHPAAQSYTTSNTRPRDRARALGIWNGGGTFGMSLGPLSISILMGVLAFQWRQVYQLWVLPILIGLVALFFLKDSTEVTRGEASDEETEPGAATTLLSKSMIMFLTSSGIRRFGGSLTAGFLTIWLVENQGWTLANLGVMFGISSLLGIVASPLGGELASRLRARAVTLKGFWPFMFFYLAQRFFGILGMPAGIAITAKLSPPRQRGMGFALSTLPGSLVGSVAPIVAAFIADSYGLYLIFVVAAVIYYVGLGVFQFGVKID
jgi:MFS family permease